jgi:heme/copper-type cytochrome/quinol oxidase subunit 3
MALEGAGGGVSEVTPSTRATSAAAAAEVARNRRSVPNGVWGMLLFVATEATLLGALIGTYFYLRFSTTTWPPPGVPAPAAVVPIALEAVLVLTAVVVVLAALAARQGRGGPAWQLLALAFVVQAGYLAWQIVRYVDELSTFSPRDSAYGSIYFTMLGADHAHVLLGLLLSAWLLVRLPSGLTNYRVVALQAVALYWVFVAVIGIFVVATQVSPS